MYGLFLLQHMQQLGCTEILLGFCHEISWPLSGCNGWLHKPETGQRGSVHYKLLQWTCEGHWVHPGIHWEINAWSGWRYWIISHVTQNWLHLGEGDKRLLCGEGIIESSFNYYNSIRPHSSIGYHAPKIFRERCLNDAEFRSTHVKKLENRREIAWSGMEKK